MPLFMVRHHTTRLNAGDPSDPRDFFRGWVDEPLSDTGHQAGEQTAQWFKDKKVGAVVTSDLARAQQSAAKIAQATGAQVQVDPRLRPWNIGALSGKEISPPLLKLSDDLQKKRPGDPAPGGESYNEFLTRYSGAVKDLLHMASTDTVVAVAHHRNTLALDALLYGKPTRTEGPPDPGGIIEITPSGAKLRFTPPKQEAIDRTGASS